MRLKDPNIASVVVTQSLSGKKRRTIGSTDVTSKYFVMVAYFTLLDRGLFSRWSLGYKIQCPWPPFLLG